MAAGLPAGRKLEVEFVPGTWTDVTPWWDLSSPVSVRCGRTSEFSAPSVGSLDGVRLNNTDGRFTPECQVLTDGTPNPYWPNVEPLRRIRYSNTPMGVRFVGRVKGWPPLVGRNGPAWVVLSATDALDRPLAHVELRSPIAQEAFNSAPALSWALTDPAGSVAAVEGSGGSALTLAGSGPALVFGEPGPGVGDGTGLRFAPDAINSGQYLTASLPLGIGWAASTVGVWVNAGRPLPAWGAGAGVQVVLFTQRSGNGTIYLVGGVPTWRDSAGTVSGSVSIANGGWHHLVATTGASGTKFYVDGVLVGTTTSTAPFAPSTLIVGDSSVDAGIHGRFQGSVGYVGLYDRALSATEIGSHWQASNGYAGDRTDQRIARWLTAAGFTAADWDLTAGKAVVGTYPQAGKTAAAAAQDMAVTEGAGAAFYAAPSGRPTFVTRTYRKPGAPTLTLSATADLTSDAYQPSYDALTLVNSCAVSRAATSGTLSEQSWTDQASVAAFGPADDKVTSYATTDEDALHLAQSVVGRNGSPGFRLGQVGVDLATATTNLYAAAATVRIGSRIRVTNLPAGLAPTTQADVIAEGWTETSSLTSYVMVFDTSPADNPPRGVWDDTTYGRWQCAGQTLNAAITGTATTLAVLTTPATLPTFTMAAARYPVSIRVGAEVITLTSAPNQAASPQTFTGCLRAQKGTPAAAQAVGAAVNLSPASTFTL